MVEGIRSHNKTRQGLGHIYPTMLMTGIKISECISDLKLKNTEGFDRIPQRILIDGHGALIEPLTQLFQMIYRDQAIPGQWLISLSNRLNLLNNKIPLDWLSLSLASFKVKCKTVFLTY